MRSRDPMFEDNYLFMDYLKGFAIVPQDNNSVLTSLSATDIQLRILDQKKDYIFQCQRFLPDLMLIQILNMKH